MRDVDYIWIPGPNGPIPWPVPRPQPLPPVVVTAEPFPWLLTIGILLLMVNATERS